MSNNRNATEGNNSPIISKNNGTVIYNQKGNVQIGDRTTIGKKFVECSDEELLQEAIWIIEASNKERLAKNKTIISDIKVRIFISVFITSIFAIYFLFIKQENLYNVTMLVVAALTLLFTIFPVQQFFQLNNTELEYKNNRQEIEKIFRYRQRKDLIEKLNKQRTSK